jgi:DNA-binding beta-propeller fold protein YncE
LISSRALLAAATNVSALLAAATSVSALLLGLALVTACRQGSGDAPTPAPAVSAYPSTRATVALPAHGLLVALRGEDRLAVVDLDARRLLEAVSVGRDPVSLDGPASLARDGTGAFYTLLAPPPSAVPPGPHAARASKERVAWLQKLAGDDLRPVGELRIGPYSGDLALSDDGTRAVATHFDLRGDADGGPPDAGDFARATILDIPTSTLRAFDSPDPVEIATCVGARGVALSRGDGRTAFVACTGEDALAVVDLAARLVRRVPLGSGGARVEPSFVARAPAGDLLAIACAGTRDVRFFDAARSTVTVARSATFDSAPGLPTFGPDGAVVYVPLEDVQGGASVIVVDAASGSTLARVTVEGCLHPAQLLRDGDTLDVLCEGDGVGPGALVVLQASSLAPLARIALGVAPSRMLLTARP